MRPARTDAGRGWRRFLSRGLPASAAVCGLLWAVQPGASQPPKTEPKAEVKEEPRYEFAMNGKPWKDVFAWLNEKTGLPVVGVAVPTGTFTFIAGNKKYTIGEVIDHINAGLLANEDTQKYFLIRGEREFVVIPADQKDKTALAPLVDIADLPKFGKSQYVTVVKRLNTLVADEVKDDFGKSLSVFGAVTAMRPNSLRITDKVGTIESVLKMIDENEKSEVAESYSHVCQWVLAREAAETLKALLPDPEKLAKLSGAPSPAPQPGGDPRFQPRTPAVVLPRPKIYAIDVNEVRNEVFVTGPADIIGKAKDLLEKKIDVKVVGQSPLITNKAPYWETHRVPGGNAELLAAEMKKIMSESNSLRITSLGTNALRVFATPEIHERIRSQIDPDGKGSVVMTKLVGVGAMSPKGTADTLIKWLGEAKTGAPNIDPVDDQNSIAVHGTQAQIDEVEAIVKALNATGGNGDNARILTLDKGSGVSVAEEMQRIMKDLYPNKVKLIGVGGAPETVPQPRPQPERPMEKVPDHQSRRLDGGDEHFVRFEQPGTLVDPQKKAPAEPNMGKPGAPVTIAAFGNKIIITSDDPVALANAMAIYKLLTKTTPTEGDFTVIKLQYAPAATAAQVLDEVFNGKPLPAPTGRVGRGNLFQFGGGAAPDGQVPGQREDRIRVVADTNTNSLIIKATPVDVLTIRRLLKTQIDTPDTNSASALKTFVVGPLKNTSATEVVAWLKELFHNQTGTSARDTQVGGFRGFALAAAQAANTPPASLSIAADDRTNSIMLLCNDGMAKQIETLVMNMDKASVDQQKKTVVISTVGVDPLVLQQALTMFGARPVTGTGSNGYPGSNQGGFNPGGNQGGFNPGGNQGGFNPGGFNRGGGNGPGGFTPGGNTGGGRRGGGAPGGMGMNVSPGGSDFFAERVKDDPEPYDIFFDPRHEYPVYEPVVYEIPVGGPADRAPAPLHLMRLDEPQQQPPAEAPPAIATPRAPISAVPLPDVGVIVLSGNTPGDVEAMIKIIEEIRKASARAAVTIKMVNLDHGDATAIVNYLNQLYQRVILQANGNAPVLAAPRTNTTQTPFGGQFTQTQSQPASVALIPLPRTNSILVAAPASQIENVIAQIKALDTPNAQPPGAPENAFGQMRAIPIKTTSATRVANLLTNFYNQRYGSSEGATSHQIRVVAEDKTNSVLVQAGPADMGEIERLISYIDSHDAAVPFDIRIIPLKTAISDDLVALLQQAILAVTENPALAPVAAPTTGTPGAPGTPVAPAIRPATGAAGTTGTASKAIQLQLNSPLGVAASGLLEDVHLSSDPRTNSVIIFAPAKTMELLTRLIQQLDIPPAAHAFVKAYQLKKANAATTANMLQQLFLGTTGTTGTTTPTAPGAPKPPGTTTPGTTGTGTPPLISISGQTPEGYPLINVRVTTDDRTNTIIYAGSENDVRTIDALIVRLDETPTPLQERRNEVYHLHTATAVDVSTALNNYVSGLLGVISRGGVLQPYEDLLQEVVVVPEPITNKLIISATPRAFDYVYHIIQELDEEPPQVVIQVTFAEVDLNGSEEFGVEIGLQSPVLFQRGIFPTLGDLGTGTVTTTGSGSNGLPSGVTVTSPVTNTVISTASPGYTFTNPALALGTNPEARPGIVGYQGITSLGVGRTSPSGSGVGGLVLSAGSDAFSLLIRALKTQARIDILNETNVTTVDNQSAGVLVGQSVPYVTGTAVSTLGTITNTISYRNVGVQLQVTPHITPDNRVIMRVLPEVSTVAATQINIGNGTTAVAFNVQNVETTVIAQDGETVALGGLISKSDTKNENKVPWLGDLAGIGSLFRFRTQTRNKTELLIILTPHVLRSSLDIKRALCAETRKMDWCLNDVERFHGPIGVRDCESVLGGCGAGVVDGALPGRPLQPGPIPEKLPVPPEPVPPGRPVQQQLIPIPPRPAPQAANPVAPPAGSAVVPAGAAVVVPSGADFPPPAVFPAPVAPADQGKESDKWQIFRK